MSLHLNTSASAVVGRLGKQGEATAERSEPSHRGASQSDDLKVEGGGPHEPSGVRVLAAARDRMPTRPSSISGAVGDSGSGEVVSEWRRPSKEREPTPEAKYRGKAPQPALERTSSERPVDGKRMKSKEVLAPNLAPPQGEGKGSLNDASKEEEFGGSRSSTSRLKN